VNLSPNSPPVTAVRRSTAENQPLPASLQPGSLAESLAEPQQSEDELRAAFQKFVAGTFYKQMLKSLRKMHDKPAYFHGGQAEEIFRAQMDQQVAENLAERQGDGLSTAMYEAFAQRIRQQLKPANAAKTATPATP